MSKRRDLRTSRDLLAGSQRVEMRVASFVPGIEFGPAAHCLTVIPELPCPFGLCRLLFALPGGWPTCPRTRWFLRSRRHKCRGSEEQLPGNFTVSSPHGTFFSASPVAGFSILLVTRFRLIVLEQNYTEDLISARDSSPTSYASSNLVGCLQKTGTDVSRENHPPVARPACLFSSSSASGADDDAGANCVDPSATLSPADCIRHHAQESPRFDIW